VRVTLSKSARADLRDYRRWLITADLIHTPE